MRAVLTSLVLPKPPSVEDAIKNIDAIMRGAVAAWLKAMLGEGLPPVWSGASRGSLLGVGDFVGIPVIISPVVNRPWVGSGTYSLTNDGRIWTFTFDTDVMQYNINEYYDVSRFIHLTHPAPWNSFKIGEEAFNVYIQQATPDLASTARLGAEAFGEVFGGLGISSGEYY